MAFKPVGVDENGSFPTRVMNSLKSLFVPSVADAADTRVDISKRQNHTDTVAAKGSQINLEHFGDGSGRPTGVGAGQTYALDIHNNPGSKSAVVVHQYSNSGPGVRLDNTGTGTMLLIAQTNNPVRNPESVDGGNASGAAIRQVDSAGASYFALLGRGEIQSNVPSDATTHAIEIIGNASAVKRLIKLTGNSTAQPLEIIQNESNTYGMTVTGKKYAAQFTVSEATGVGVRITRSNTTGSGDVLDLRNDSATGRTLLIRQGTTEVAKINVDGSIEIVAAGVPFIAKSLDGTRYKLTPPNGGGAATWVPA